MGYTTFSDTPIDVEDSPLVAVDIGGVQKCVGNISHRQILLPRCYGYVPIQLLSCFVSPCKCVCVLCKVYRIYYASHHIRLVCFLRWLYQCIVTAPANSDDPPSVPPCATERLGPGNLPRGANGATWALHAHFCCTKKYNVQSPKLLDS